MSPQPVSFLTSHFFQVRVLPFPSSLPGMFLNPHSPFLFPLN